MGITILKIIGIMFITALGICLFRRLANNFSAWKYEREHIEYLRAREECRREQNKKRMLEKQKQREGAKQ